MIFLHHVVVQNNPSKETLSAGLGPAGQYGIIIVVLIIVGIVLYIKRKKKK